MKTRKPNSSILTASICLLASVQPGYQQPAISADSNKSQEANALCQVVKVGSSTGSANGSTEQKPVSNAATPSPAVEPRAVSPSAQINVVPFLVGGHPCTLSVVDADGKPIDRAGVFVDQELFCSGANGTITFTVPYTESFELSMLGEGQKKIGKLKFVRGADRVYSDNDKLADMAASLLKIENSGAAPVILYAPAVLSPNESFVIVGHNLSEKIANDYLDIDGANAKIVSASPDGVLAIAPSKLSIGPLRELFMTINGQASNAAELDIATPFFTHEKTEADDVSPQKGKIGMNGTNVPCLIRVHNNDAENVSLWSPTQEPLGKTNVMLSPGGDQNYLNVFIRILTPPAEPRLDLSLVQGLAGSNEFAQIPPQLLTALCRAEIMRLERRRISASFRLDELRKKEAGAGAANTAANTAANAAANTAANAAANTIAADSEKEASEKKVLSTRLRRVSIMLAARRVIYESLGNTDAQYRQALDDAAGGALFSLDQSVRPIQIVSEPSAGTVATEIKPLKTGKSGRPLRLLEPPIRLLPPMNEAQLALMTAREKSFSSVSVETRPASPEAGGSPDSPTLRPSIPEPEPEVSASNRASLPAGQKTDKTEKAEKGKKTDSAKGAAKSDKKADSDKEGAKPGNKAGSKKTQDQNKTKAAGKGKPDAKSSSKSKRKGKHRKEEPVVHTKRRHGRKTQAAPVKQVTSSKRHRHHHHSSS